MPNTLVLADAIAGGADALPPAFACSWTDGGPEAGWVHVAGELDGATVPHLERTLRLPELQARLVVLDLRDLEFIDSAGVHAIVSASSRARESGRRLVLVRGSQNVDRMFSLTGCSDELEIGDLDEVRPPVEMRLHEEVAS